MKLPVVLSNKGKCAASITRHDFREIDGVFIDGGIPGVSGDYFRSNGQIVWVEVPQSFPVLYEDYQYNIGEKRKFGIWRYKEVRILPAAEIPDTNSIEWMAENAIYAFKKGKKFQYKLLKELSRDELLAIDASKQTDKIQQVIKFLLENYADSESRFGNCESRVS